MQGGAVVIILIAQHVVNIKVEAVRIVGPVSQSVHPQSLPVEFILLLSITVNPGDIGGRELIATGSTPVIEVEVDSPAIFYDVDHADDLDVLNGQ